MSGKREPDTYAIVRIAECLKLDPLELIAEFGEAQAKVEVEREYWRGFLGRVRQRLLPFIMVLLCTLTGAIDTPQGGGFRRLRLCA
jgi:hypothetical protein